MANEVVPGASIDHAEVTRQYQEQLDFLFSEICRTGEATSAERVMEACKFLRDQRVKKITASGVGDYCMAKWNGPRASSISNKPKTLAQLVKLHDALHQATSQRAVRKPLNLHNNLRVDDPGIASYIHILESKVRQLERENQRLIQGFKNLQSLQIGTSTSSGVTPPLLAGPAVTNIERDAIHSFFKQIEKVGFLLDERRRIMDGSMIIMERPVVELLTKLAKAAG